jgi:hypothetical protein
VHFGKDHALVVCRVSADTVAHTIKQSQLQEAVEEGFHADADPILMGVHIVDVAVIVGVIHGDPRLNALSSCNYRP